MMSIAPVATTDRAGAIERMSPLLSIRDLSVTLGGRAVLRGIRLDVARGEIVAVVGPNGAGKSTLLAGVVGAVAHSGVVAIDGRDRASFRERAPLLAYVPDAMMMPEETTLERALGLDRAGTWAGRLGVGPIASRHASATSRGELERAALAAALDLADRGAGRPVLLLDEPFGALDPKQVREVVPIVREACRSRAALVTVHQLSIAERVADRIALLVRGELAAIGTPAELRARAHLEPSASLEDVFLALLERDANDEAAAS